MGLGNRLLLEEEKLLANTCAVQTRDYIDVPDAAAALEALSIFDAPANHQRQCPVWGGQRALWAKHFEAIGMPFAVAVTAEEV